MGVCEDKIEQLKRDREVLLEYMEKFADKSNWAKDANNKYTIWIGTKTVPHYASLAILQANK